jgi:hypothetical protein
VPKTSGAELYIVCRDKELVKMLENKGKFTILITLGTSQQNWSVRGNIVGGLPYFKSKETIEREKKEEENRIRKEEEERTKRENEEKARQDVARQEQTEKANGARIFFATLPPKADIYIDGKRIGTSNEGELEVPIGTHQVRFVKDGVEKTETVTFNPGKNPTIFVNLK